MVFYTLNDNTLVPVRTLFYLREEVLYKDGKKYKIIIGFVVGSYNKHTIIGKQAGINIRNLGNEKIDVILISEDNIISAAPTEKVIKCSDGENMLIFGV